MKFSTYIVRVEMFTSDKHCLPKKKMSRTSRRNRLSTNYIANEMGSARSSPHKVGFEFYDVSRQAFDDKRYIRISCVVNYGASKFGIMNSQSVFAMPTDFSMILPAFD